MDFMSMSERSEEVFLVWENLSRNANRDSPPQFSFMSLYLSYQSFPEKEMEDVPDDLFAFIEF